jgi:hypothetical protein
MGVPTSEVGDTAAMPRREDYDVHKDMWWGHWEKKKIGVHVILTLYTSLSKDVRICGYIFQRQKESQRKNVWETMVYVICVLALQAILLCVDVGVF